MDIIYRPAQMSDEGAISKVFAEAVIAVHEKHGYTRPAVDPAGPNPTFAFLVEDHAKGCWVAEDPTEVIGYCTSWVYGSLWFLSQLFVLPRYQGQHVGHELMVRALAYGSGKAITNRALITFAFNLASISLYMRHGLYPRESLYGLRSSTPSARPQHTPPGTVEHTYEKVGNDPITLSRLAWIDESILGIQRPRFHQYLLEGPGASCYLFHSGGTPRGYAYVWPTGRVGPLAVAVPSDLKGVMRSAFTLATATGAEHVSTLVPGSNEDAVTTALEHGLRITVPFLLMSSRPFGSWTRYLFYSPALI